MAGTGTGTGTAADDAPDFGVGTVEALAEYAGVCGTSWPPCAEGFITARVASLAPGARAGEAIVMRVSEGDGDRVGGRCRDMLAALATQGNPLDARRGGVVWSAYNWRRGVGATAVGCIGTCDAIIIRFHATRGVTEPLAETYLAEMLRRLATRG
jgi:hypothetical protein